MLNWFENINLAHPELLLLLLPVALVFAYALQSRWGYAAIRLSNLEGIRNTFSWRIRLRKFIPVLRALTVCLLVLAIAR
ncbi:MAG: hypothetical protein KJT03_23445, partial [Verrucomicrobiae bacterium]|nr:hypothetical protein [Verrucomicrobiae bacterium]